MGTAQVKQFTLMPALSYCLQFFTKDRPMPEVVPPRRYLIKDIFWVVNQ